LHLYIKLFLVFLFTESRTYMNDPKDFAPGAPGMEPHRAKTTLSGLGKSFLPSSHLTFGLSKGIVSDVCFPAEDQTCAHDLETIVTDGHGFFSEEKRHTDHEVTTFEEGIPAFKVVNTCREGHYRITKEILSDPLRDTLLQKTLFEELVPSPEAPYRFHLLLSPHIDGDSDGHTAWIGSYKGLPLLFASKGGITMALACSLPWSRTSVGFRGVSDGWMQLAAHGELTREYHQAESGRVVLSAEVALTGPTTFLVALGAGSSEGEAAGKAWASLLDGFEPAKERYLAQWRSWQHSLSVVSAGPSIGKCCKTGAMVLRVLEAKASPGAQLSGWPEAEGGFPVLVVRPRDLASAFGAYIALDAREDAVRLLGYLMSNQEEAGYWPLALHPNGHPAGKTGLIPLDQMAHVILMVDTLRKAFLLSPEKMQRYWEIVLKAAGYLVSHGPQTPVDRWGEPGAISPYTLAVEIAALLAVADMADEKQQPGIATYCRKTADYLNENVEHWTYITGTPAATEAGVKGYYAHNSGADLPSADPLALVRFGIRAADDPRILDTVKVIDTHLKTETPFGPTWKRFGGDTDTWSLLTAERAQYELAAGNRERAAALVATLEALARNSLFPDKTGEGPTVSPSTIVHAEYIKLCCSLKANKVLDLPRFTTDRYVKGNPPAPFVIWRFRYPCSTVPPGKKLRIEVNEAALIHWSDNEWGSKQHILTRDTGLGVHVAELTPKVNGGKKIEFTFFWLSPERWETKNYSVTFT
jgi:glucoamylase